MQEIINPFKRTSHCFGCSPENQIGLKLNFFRDDEELVSYWEPRTDLIGYDGVIHGGIQSTLLDEIASWSVYALEGTSGVTSEIHLQYYKPVYIAHGKVELRAKIEGREGRNLSLNTRLINGKGEVCTGGIIKYYTFPEKMARVKFGYPGVDAFYRR